jgi:hypothetical protein
MPSTIRMRIAALNRAIVSTDQDSAGIVEAPWEPGGRPTLGASVSAPPLQLDPEGDDTPQRLRRWHDFEALAGRSSC